MIKLKQLSYFNMPPINTFQCPLPDADFSALLNFIFDPEKLADQDRFHNESYLGDNGTESVHIQGVFLTQLVISTLYKL